MRLEHLCDVQWQYDLLDQVELAQGRTSHLYGQGTAAFTGRLAGIAHWSNFPRLHAGFANPDARGSLDVGDGHVLFTLLGLSDLVDGSGIHVMKFMTDVASHLWVNDVIAIGEGSIDLERSALSMRYYECLVDSSP